mgnify:CR=1 FL=1
MNIKSLLIASFIIMFQSCALMISGAKQEVTFKSNTDGARVFSNYESIGYTNQEIKIPRGNLNQMYTISKEGCLDTSFVLPLQTNWLVMIDLLGFPLFNLPIVYDYIWDVNIKTDEIIQIDLDCSGN